MKKILFFIVFILFCATLSAQTKPVAQGYLDLSAWDFEKQGSRNLDGEWEFYWNKLLDYEDFKNISEPDAFVQYPAIWNGWELNGEKLNGIGFGTYRLRFRTTAKSLALKVLPHSSAYRLFLNDSLLAKNGTVGTNGDTHNPESLSQTVVFPIQNPENELIIQVSNFNHEVGGVFHSLRIGTPAEMLRRQTIATSKDIFLIGVLLMAVMYHFALFSHRRSDRAPLFFAIFCSLILIRMMLAGENVFHYFFPYFSWDLLLRAEYCSFYLIPAAWLMFMKHIFPKFISQKIYAIIFYGSFAFVVPTLFLPSFYYTALLSFFQAFFVIELLVMLFFLFRTVFRKNEEAKKVLFANTILFGTAINDVLYAKLIINTGYTAAWGLFGFILMYAYVISRRVFAIEKEKKIIEIQKEELRQTTIELEQLNAELQKAEYQVKVALDKEQMINSELEKTLDSLQQTQNKLFSSEKLASIGQLTAGVAHEINNPINFVYGGIQSLQVLLEHLFEVLDKYKELDELESQNLNKFKREIRMLKEDIEYEELLEELQNSILDIKTGAERTTEISKSLRIFVRADEDILQKADIHNGIDSTLVILRNQYKGRIEIIKNYNPELPKIECYFGKLNQVFMNLLSNAIQAIKDEGTITISTEQRGNFVEIRISDTGSGISPENMSNLFKPFFTTKGVGEGTGLGLSISKSIIEKHRGTIEVSSEPNRGTTFTISLPIVAEEQS